MPARCLDDPALAGLLEDVAGDVVLSGLGGRTVADCLPRERTDLLVVTAEATPLEVAALMARTGAWLAVVAGRASGGSCGVITADVLLDRILRARPRLQGLRYPSRP